MGGSLLLFLAQVVLAAETGLVLELPRGWTTMKTEEALLLVPPGSRIDPARGDNPELYFATSQQGYNAAEEAQFSSQMSAAFLRNGIEVVPRRGARGAGRGFDVWLGAARSGEREAVHAAAVHHAIGDARAGDCCVRVVERCRSARCGVASDGANDAMGGAEA